MNLAIGLMTADRPEYTERTCASFNKLNRWLEHVDIPIHKFHADDKSETHANHAIAGIYGFRTLHASIARKGVHRTRQEFIKSIRLTCDPSHILILENDIESVAPLPWDLIRYTFLERKNIHALRLYGKYKEADHTRPCGPAHAGKSNRNPAWVDVVGMEPAAEVGDIHWSPLPCIMDAGTLSYLHTGTDCDKDSVLKSGRLQTMTARVKENVMHHIGTYSTPRFKK